MPAIPVTLCIVNHNGAEHLCNAVTALRCQAWRLVRHGCRERKCR